MQKSLLFLLCLLQVSGLLYGQGHSATVLSNGNHNNATINQKGAKHTATITQWSKANFSNTGNHATISQEAAGQADRATIQQGTQADPTHRSNALIRQRNTGHGHYYGNKKIFVLTFEDAQDPGTLSGNVARIEQVRPQGNSSVLQDGHANQALVRLVRGFSKVSTNIVQEGLANQAQQIYGNDPSGANWGSMTITQRGEENEASQTGPGFGQKDFAIHQEGRRNIASQFVYQNGHATTRQYGEDNQAYIEVPDNSNSSSKTNKATIEQGTGQLDVRDNYARIWQGAGANTGTIRQFSDENHAALQQLGSGNEATIVQGGLGLTENYVDLQQSGGALADILQLGSNNFVVGLDGGLGEANATTALSLQGARLFLDQIGTGNLAKIGQNGGIANVRQVGNHNTVTISQNQLP